MKSWSKSIYDAGIRSKILIRRNVEKKLKAEAEIRWVEAVNRVTGPLENMPQIRNVNSAGRHYSSAVVRPALETYLDTMDQSISRGMHESYLTSRNLVMAAMRDPLDRIDLTVKEADVPPGDDFIFHIPNEDGLEAIRDTKFLETTLEAWKETTLFDNLDSLAKVYADGLRAGLTMDQIARTIRDTMGRPLNSARALARTAVMGASNRAIKQVYDANADLLKGYIYVATLDTRTCEICGGYDGNRYKLGERYPEPPVHVYCRCTIIAWMKSAAELGIPVPALDPETRAAMDGEVPASMTYPEWLKSQDKETQIDALGSLPRWEKWKKGEITFESALDDDLEYEDPGEIYEALAEEGMEDLVLWP